MRRNVSGTPCTRSGAAASTAAVSFGTTEFTTYCWLRELVSTPLMLNVAGSQLHRPDSPLTDDGAYGAGRYGLVNWLVLTAVTTRSCSSPVDPIPGALRPVPACLPESRSSGDHESPSKLSTVTERRYGAWDAFVA